MNYHYRIGLYKPFTFFSQKVEYLYNENTGNLETLSVNERIEENTGS